MKNVQYSPALVTINIKFTLGKLIFSKQGSGLLYLNYSKLSIIWHYFKEQICLSCFENVLSNLSMFQSKHKLISLLYLVRPIFIKLGSYQWYLKSHIRWPPVLNKYVEKGQGRLCEENCLELTKFKIRAGFRSKTRKGEKNAIKFLKLTSRSCSQFASK